MRIEGEYVFKAGDPEEVWEALNTPEIIAKAMPGCEKFEVVGEGNYEAVISIGISVIKGTYNTNISITEKNKPSFVLCIDSTGAVGFVRLRAPITIKANDKGSGTLLIWEAEGEVGGLIAGVGNRILSGVAKLLVGQFFKSIEQQIVLAAAV